MDRRFEALVSPDVLQIEPYKPGKPIEELKRERGFSRVVKLASNENPLGASPKAARALTELGEKLNRYPDGFGFELKKALSKRWGVGIDQIALGNGSSEIIEMAVRLFVRPGAKVVLASPSFSIYSITVRAQGGEVTEVGLKGHGIDLQQVADAVDPETSMVILGNPNNPTGTVFSKTDFECFLSKIPEDVVVLLDEAYAEYDDSPDQCLGRDYVMADCPAPARGRPILAARTFSKAYGLAAVRIGYALAPAEIVDYMNRLRLPFNANAAAQNAALAALADTGHLARSVRVNSDGRERLYRFFSELGIEYIESSANFITVRVGDGDEFFERMLDEGVITRSVRSFGMPEWVRITVGSSEDLDIFEKACRKVLAAMGDK